MLELQRALAVVEVLQQAAPASVEFLAGCAQVKQFKKGRHVFFDKDQIDFVYCMVSGKVALYKLNSSQNKKVIFIYGTGKLLNEVILQEAVTSVSCEVLEDSMLLVIPKAKFLYVMSQDFTLTKAVLDSMALKIRRLYRQLENTAYNFRGDKRIAAKLWKLSLDHGVLCEQGTEIDLDMTITYFSDLVGAKRETVSRQLRWLTERGLVIIKKNRFIIPDRSKLLTYIEQAD